MSGAGLKVTVKVEGLRDLDAALGRLKASTAKGVLRRVGKAALQPFDAAWRSRAPRRTGELAGSGGVGSKLSRSQREAHERESFVEVFAGPGPNPQAIQEEFGNSHQPPRPFVRPAWEETKRETLEIVKTELGGEIVRTAARAAKRAARLAAKTPKG